MASDTAQLSLTELKLSLGYVRRTSSPDTSRMANRVPLSFTYDGPMLDCELTPRTDQLEEMAFLRTRKRGATWSPPGKGKMLTCALAAVPPVEVVCPSYMAAKWADWLNTHVPASRGHIYLCTGSNLNKTERIHRLAEAHGDPRGWTIVNVDMLRPELDEYEVAGKKMQRAVLDNHGDWVFEYPHPPTLTSIIDEAHWLRGRSAWRSMGAVKLFQSTPYLFQATATPKYKDEDDYFEQLRILRPNIFTSYLTFQKMYLKTWNSGWRNEIIGLKDFDTFIHSLRNYVTRHDYAPDELPPFLELDPFIIEPTSATRRTMDLLRNSYRLEGKPITSAGAMIAEFDRLAVCPEKMEPLADWINDNAPRLDGTQRGTLVFVWQKETARKLQAFLQKTTKRFYAIIDGDVPYEKRAIMAERADNVIATLASVSEGIDMSHLSLVAMFEEYHTFGADYQGLRRSLRPRHDSHPYIVTHPWLAHWLMTEPIIVSRWVLRYSADEAKREHVERRTGNAMPVLQAVLRG